MIGEPYAGKSHVRFDEGVLETCGLPQRACALLYLMSRAGSKSTFKESRDDLQVYAGLTVSAKDVERVAESIGKEIEHWAAQERQVVLHQQAPPMPAETIPVLYISYDGTGIPMIPEALRGRRGKQADGTAKTREVKLGCIFTQTTTDEKGFPLRDPDSTTFVGAIETAAEFGWRIYAEAVRRGLHHAEKVAILGDAARWIHGLAEEHFPGAIEIVDLYHAREHLAALCKLLFGANEKPLAHWRIRWWTDLDAGRVEKIVAEAQDRLPQEEGKAKLAQNEIHYFTENKERMRYADFRAQGLFVGSGVVEAGCKTVIGQRLKQSGMEWSVGGANAIIALRCCILSGRFEDFWDSRRA